MQDGNKFDPRSWVLSNLGLIDRAWELHWALRLTQAIFFFDIAMRLTGSPGLVGWDSSVQAVTGNIGFILITFAAFTLSMSILVPIAMHLLGLLLCLPIVEKVFAPDHEPYHGWRRPYGRVTISDLESEGDRRNDPSLYRLAEEHQEKRRLRDAELSRMIATMTGTLILTVLNAFPVLVCVYGGTILDELMHYVGYDWSSVVLVLILLGLLSTILTLRRSQFSQYWVRHPELHSELEAERRKEQDLRAQMTWR